MSPPPARLAGQAAPVSAAPASGSDERRRQSRVARFDVVHQAAGRLVLVDVSSFGCCVRHADPDIGPGHFVMLQFATVGTINGYVRWRDDENMGVEFCRAIPPATERALATDEPLEGVRRL